MTLATAMAAVLVMWLLVGGAFVGLGLAWRRLFRGRSELAGEVFLAFWSGFALVLMFLQLWHLVLPINAAALAVVLVAGWLGVMTNRAAWIGTFREARLGTLVVALLTTAWIANRAIGPGNAEDSGLYHYRAVRWATAYPVVPGIGNLSAALALNNVSFLYDAMLEAGPWYGRSNHLANGLLLAALFAGIITSAARIWRARSATLAADAYLLTLLPVAVYLALGKDVSSPKTDLPVGFMTFVAGYLALRLLAGPMEPRGRLFGIVTLALLCAAAICLKFSGIVVVTLIVAVVLLVWLKRDKPAPRGVLTGLAGSAAVAAALLGPWTIRNVIMSGYPLYPSKAAAVDIEWRVPPPAVDYLVGAIRNQAKAGLILWAYDNLNATGKRPFVAYARLMKPPFTSRDEVRGLEWVRPWFFSLPITSPIEVVLPACVTIAAALIVFRRGVRRAGAAALLLLPMLAGVAFWLWAGPEPRYGWQTMWALAAATVALAVLAAEQANLRALRAMVVLALVLVVPGVIYRAGVAAFLRHGNPLAEIPFLPPGPDHGFHPKPVQTFAPVRTRWGTTIYLPDRPDQPLTWDGPLPCTAWPPLDMDLRLRNDSDIATGFRIDRSQHSAGPMMKADAGVPSSQPR